MATQVKAEWVTPPDLGDVELRAGKAPDTTPRLVTLPLNAMRCPVCGHRLDDMDGCDSCSADREEAIRQSIEEGADDGD